MAAPKEIEIFHHADSMLIFVRVPAVPADRLHVTLEDERVLVTADTSDGPRRLEVPLARRVDLDRTELRADGETLMLMIPCAARVA